MAKNVPTHYIVSFQIKTNLASEEFPSLCSNKEWDDSDVIDLISSSNMGLTLESGIKKGWALFLQPNGAWGWNIGDGKKRLDYLPTTIQKINDDKWHQIEIVYCLNDNTVWFYFDKRHVAIYSLSELDLEDKTITENNCFAKHKSFTIKDEKACDVNSSYQNKYLIENHENSLSPNLFKSKKLNVMSWNIYHGGRHNGVDHGIGQVINAIKESGADLVCMQETYGSGPAISDALGTIFYYRSSNLSIHSRFPIVDTYDIYKPFRLGGLRVKLGDQLLDIFSLWIHHLPSLEELYPTASIAEILQEENKTRGAEISDILDSLKMNPNLGENIPLIIGGDFNSLSHLDWKEDMKHLNKEYVIEWPVSKAMAEFDMIDSFREMAPAPWNSRGFTYSPRYKEPLQRRIDYLYYKGNLKCVNSYVKGYTDSEWPSDHAAIIADYRFQ